MNPVRAGMVDGPAHYRWSSYRCDGLGQDDELITAHALYTELAVRPATRQSRYRELFAHENDVAQITDIRMALNQSQPLGNSRFIDTIERMTGERREVRPRGRPRLLAAPDGGW